MLGVVLPALRFFRTTPGWTEPQLIGARQPVRLRHLFECAVCFAVQRLLGRLILLSQLLLDGHFVLAQLDTARARLDVTGVPGSAPYITHRSLCYSASGHVLCAHERRADDCAKCVKRYAQFASLDENR